MNQISDRVLVHDRQERTSFSNVTSYESHGRYLFRRHDQEQALRIGAAVEYNDLRVCFEQTLRDPGADKPMRASEQESLVR